jgi:hypothetical protein
MSRPPLSEIPVFYREYVKAVSTDDLDEALHLHITETEDFLLNLPVDKQEFAYAPGKWTIKEMVQHVMDSERVFAYRALRFSRMDPTPLPGFDENLFAQNSFAPGRNFNDLMEEFHLLRKSTYYMFRSFTPEQLSARGIANGNEISVLSTGFILAGHMKHHIRIIRERYL